MKNPTATPGAGFIKLKWEMPVNVNFTKMKVIYHDPVTKEDKELEIADNTTNLFIVDNTFKCGGEYEFTIKTYGPTGMETEQPAVVRGTSGESVIKAPIALTVDMFSANATEPSEGSLAALVDDNINTYYHTIWSGTSPNKQPHYLQINMSELPLQSLRFEYDGRNNGNGAGDVKRVGIWGSDNNNTWTLMGKETYTLPGSRGQHVEPNENIKAGKPYKYIRFIPEARRDADPIDPSGGNGWWNMAGIYLYKINDHDEAWARKELGI